MRRLVSIVTMLGLVLVTAGTGFTQQHGGQPGSQDKPPQAAPAPA